MTEAPDFPTFVGPHENRELELLLAGTKPLARLTSEPSTGFMEDLSAYEPYVATGRIIRVDATHHLHTPSGEDVPIIKHYFCLPTEEWRIKLMELLHNADTSSFTTDDLHRMDGHLLGYTEADIEAFITWQNRAR